MGRPAGIRPSGRPGLEWGDQVKSHLEVSTDVHQWKQFLGEAKNHLGFVLPQK